MVNKFLSAVLLIFLISGVSALSTTLKEQYSQGETAIFEVSGNILEPITSGQISFLRGHVLVPFEYGVSKNGGVNYIWAVMPQNVQNYTLKLQGISTMSAGVVNSIDYYQNFSVGGNLSSFSIKPGVVKTNKDFEMSAFLSGDKPKTITVNFPEDREVLLLPGENTLKFSIERVSESSAFKMNIGNYVVPIEVIVNKNGSYVDAEDKTNKLKLEFTPKEIKRIVIREVPQKAIILPLSIKNIGNESIKSLEMEYNKEKFGIDRESIKELKANQEARFNLTLKAEAFSASQDKFIESVKFKSGNLSSEILVEITLADENASVNNATRNSTSPSFTCAEYGGKVCSADEKCEGELKSTIQGSCCIGYCVQQEPEPTSYAWIGYLVIAVVIIAGAWAWYKYKGFKLPMKPLGAPKGALDKPSA